MNNEYKAKSLSESYDGSLYSIICIYDIYTSIYKLVVAHIN